MSEIINISAYLVSQPIRPYADAQFVSTASSSARPVEDSLELSDFGRSLSQSTELSTYQLARIRAIRAEIEQGIYETPQRLSGTVAKMIDILG